MLWHCKVVVFEDIADGWMHDGYVAEMTWLETYMAACYGSPEIGDPPCTP